MCEERVVVLGAGPAGCAAALACAEAGLAVTLLESQEFPRDRPGETLHPGVEPIFRQMGVFDQVLAAGFLRHAGSWVRWGGPRRFDAFGSNGSDPWLGFQAWRADLDALLLESARKAGAQILQPCRARRPLVQSNRVVGVLTADGEEIRARFVVDAAGRGHWLARQLGLRLKRYSPRLLAHYGYAEGTCPSLAEAPALLADEDGWTWMARVRPGLYQWTRLSLSGKKLEAGWRPAELHVLSPKGRTHGADVTWRRVSRAAGLGYYLAGDAATVLDPTSSHGVLKALMSGMLAAYRITQTLRAAVPEELAARTYDEWVRNGFEHDVHRLAEHYKSIPAWRRWLNRKEIPSAEATRFARP